MLKFIVLLSLTVLAALHLNHIFDDKAADDEFYRRSAKTFVSNGEFDFSKEH